METIPINTVVLDVETAPKHKKPDPYADRMLGIGHYTYQTDILGYSKRLNGGILGLRDKHLVFANGSYDLDIIRHTSGGVDIMEPNTVWDVSIMAKIIYNLRQSYSLKMLAYMEFGDPHFAEMEMQKTGRKISEANPDKVAEYCKYDVYLTAALFSKYYPIVKDDPAMQQEVECSRTVWRMMHRPIRIHPVRVHLGQRKVIQTIKRAKAQGETATEIPGFNVSSSHQVTAFLKRYHPILVAEMKLTKTGLIATDKKALARLPARHPLFDAMATLKTVSAEKKYYDNILVARKYWKSNNICLRIRQSEASTRRFTSSGYGPVKINAQNFSESSKSCFSVPKGYVGVFIDYSQIENIIHILYSLDRERWELWESDPKWNEYIWLAEKITGRKITDKKDPEYRLYKSMKLGINYGEGEKKFARETGIDEHIVRRKYADIHRVQPAIRSLSHKLIQKVRRDTYLTDPYGYKYFGTRGAEYKIVAHYIQGTACSIIKEAMINCDKQCIKHGKDMLITSIHDELGFYLWHDDSWIERARDLRHTMCVRPTTKLGITFRAGIEYTFNNWKEKKAL